MACYGDVQNGDFSHTTASADALPAPVGMTLWAGDSQLLHWGVQSGPVRWLNFEHAAAHAVELGPGAVLQQTIDTTPGQLYDVRFLFYSTYQAPSRKSLSLSDGVGIARFSDDSAGDLPGNHTWIDEHWSFTARSAETLLTWTSTTEAGQGPYMTDVLVQPRSATGSDELDLWRAYTRLRRALLEHDSHAVFRQQSTDYVYQDIDGTRLDRLAYNVGVEAMLPHVRNAHIDLVSLHLTEDRAQVQVRTSVDLGTEQAEGLQQDIWVRTGAGWRLLETRELKP